MNIKISATLSGATLLASIANVAITDNPAQQAIATVAPPLEHSIKTEERSQFLTENEIACLVGQAEGTRTSDCGFTDAYYGHTDPGNGVWNLGSFSYQHGASSPEDADDKWVYHLRTEAIAKIQAQANQYQVKLTFNDWIQALDLYTQSPLAAEGSYVMELAEYKQQHGNAVSTDGYVNVRSQSYIDPATGRLDAPGLGNDYNRVQSDQRRRVMAIMDSDLYKKLVSGDDR